ncbi:MAG: endonuclease domain-containing protein [Actinomycetota bacterium]|nr:endonuclease domain-containing protein [Actinomycetota bacterium]
MSRGPQPYKPRPRRGTPPVPEGHAYCPACKQVLNLDSFHKLASARSGRQNYCIECKREKHLSSRYGITAEQYERLLHNQSGRCAICRNLPRTQLLAVDHNHKTGEVRGLLCRICNQKLLGAAFDQPHRLFEAGLYLLNPPARKVLGEPEELA